MWHIEIMAIDLCSKSLQNAIRQSTAENVNGGRRSSWERRRSRRIGEKWKINSIFGTTISTMCVIHLNGCECGREGRKSNWNKSTSIFFLSETENRFSHHQTVDSKAIELKAAKWKIHYERKPLPVLLWYNVVIGEHTHACQPPGGRESYERESMRIQ